MCLCNNSISQFSNFTFTPFYTVIIYTVWNLKKRNFQKKFLHQRKHFMNLVQKSKFYWFHAFYVHVSTYLEMNQKVSYRYTFYNVYLEILYRKSKISCFSYFSHFRKGKIWRKTNKILQRTGLKKVRIVFLNLNFFLGRLQTCRQKSYRFLLNFLHFWTV